jgi:hypothetical protein
MPQDSLPEFMREERDAIIAEAYAAWKGVTREGGVSWTETTVIDDNGEMEERLAARESDIEESWEGLVTRSDWPGEDGASFGLLDPIGFRYYVAPALIRTLEGEEIGLRFYLTIELDDHREYHLEKWSLLDDRQRTCIARAIRLMWDWHGATRNLHEACQWQHAYERHWRSIDAE